MKSEISFILTAPIALLQTVVGYAQGSVICTTDISWLSLPTNIISDGAWLFQ